MSQPSNSKCLSFLQALRMATTSACADGSLVAVTELAPSATTLPSLTTTAPKGPPRPAPTLASDNSMARCMNRGSGALLTCFRVGASYSGVNVRFVIGSKRVTHDRLAWKGWSGVELCHRESNFGGEIVLIKYSHFTIVDHHAQFVRR